LAAAVALIRACPAAAALETEASGGVTLASAAAIAATGVTHVSCGAITHSSPALDISMGLVLGDKIVQKN
jgi:nicotinate-nucleotide pyrophosphorylase (carboxylating)